MAVGDKFAGANLSITIGGTALTCPQSYRVIPTSSFVEYNCPGATGTQRVFVAKNWDGSVMDYVDNDDQAKINAWNAAAGTDQAVVINPDGSTSGQMTITFDAFVDAGLEGGMGNIGSVPINLTINGGVTVGTLGA